MPQLDKAIFFSQFTWVFFIFFLLYIILREFFLPEYIMVLKYRNNKKSLKKKVFNNLVNNFTKNYFSLLENVYTFLKRKYTNSTSFILETKNYNIKAKTFLNDFFFKSNIALNNQKKIILNKIEINI